MNLVILVAALAVAWPRCEPQTHIEDTEHELKSECFGGLHEEFGLYSRTKDSQKPP